MSSNLPVSAELGHAPTHAPEIEPAPPSEAVGADNAFAPQEAPWERYVTTLLRHKWLLVMVTVVGTIAGIVATRFVELQYVAQSTLWIEVAKQTEEERGPIREGQLLQAAAWLELLKSFTVLDYAVKEQRLFVSPERPEDAPALAGLDVAENVQAGQYRVTVDAAGTGYELATSEGRAIERGQVGHPVGAGIGLKWSPGADVLRPGRTLGFTVRIPRDVARQLADQLTTKMPTNGNFITLSLSGTDPQRISSTVNSVAKRYVEVAAQLKRAKLDELTVILNEQLRYAEANLREAEIALEDLRIETVTLPAAQASPVAGGVQMTRDPVFTNYFDMKVRREQLRQDREDVERVLREAERSPAALDALIGISAVTAAPELAQALEQRIQKRTEVRALQQRYTDEYAPVQALLREIRDLETDVIPTMARNVVAQLASRETEAEQRIGSASTELREIPSRAIEEARLERQVEIAEQLQTTLKQRYEVARLAAAGSVPDIRVLDSAVAPSAPTDDPRPLFFLAGMFGSLGLAVAGVLLLDRVDPRIRYPEQVTKDMGVPVIGVVPHFKQILGGSDEINASAVCEAFRQLRMSVSYAHGAAGPIQFTVTSAEAGDGKSFVSSNLALAFAQQGHRTLLIDGDIRRGRLHHLLEGSRSPGLTDYLSGTVGMEEIVQPTRFANVSLMGSGTRMEVGPELLGSSGMGQLLRHLRSRFDVIVVDSPPLGAGVDPYVLGTVTSNLLLVFRTGTTNRAFASAKLGLLDRLPIRVLGAVLNDVPANQRAYRYYSYLPGYAASNEPQLHSVVGTHEAGAGVSQPPRALR